MTKEAELDDRFSFGPPPIQTAEDAVMAFLRKEITEDEFRAACDKYGVLPGTLFNPHSARVERVDAAYEQTLPEDLFPEATPPPSDVKERLDAVKEKEDAREKAAKEAGPNPLASVPAGATPVHEVGGVKTSERNENEKLPKAQEVSTKK